MSRSFTETLAVDTLEYSTVPGSREPFTSLLDYPLSHLFTGVIGRYLRRRCIDVYLLAWHGLFWMHMAALEHTACADPVNRLPKV